MSTEQLYVSFHGGDGGYNNLHVYDLEGNELGKAIDKSTLPDWVMLQELRGFCIGPDGMLYVANAYKNYSNIVRFAFSSGDAEPWQYDSIFVQGNTQANPGLMHPYGVVFGPDGHLYTSSQDTDLVSRYAGPGATCPGMPLPSLVEGFPPGTFAALQGTFQTGQFGIRGIAFGLDGCLYAANETDNAVHVYDLRGVLQTTIASTGDVTIDSPVQVQFDATAMLYIGSSKNNAVITYADEQLAYLIGPQGQDLDAVSGIGFDAAGTMYVGSRKSNAVLGYALPNTDPTTLLSDLSDNPEFVAVLSPGS